MGHEFYQTNYDEDDVLKRLLIRIETHGGTITRQVPDVRTLVTAVWIGADDTSATRVTNASATVARRLMAKSTFSRTLES